MHSVVQAICRSLLSTGWREVHTLLAVSGGADSVALLRAMDRLKQADGGQGRLFVGHFHHRLRPSADADQQWVLRLCRHLGISFEAGYAEPQSLTKTADGVEAAARQARYTFLQTTAERVGARFVVTAHTADDQAETVLHHLLRGTGLAGLAGMPFARPLGPTVSLIRPMLEVRRSEILDFLRGLPQDFRTDFSNHDQRFTRNRLRENLLPKLRSEYNQDVHQALIRLARQASEAQALIAEAADEQIEHAAAVSRSQVTVHVERLVNQPTIIVREVFKRAWSAAGWPMQSMGFEEWQLLADMLRSDCSPRVLNLPANVRAERIEGKLVMERLLS